MRNAVTALVLGVGAVVLVGCSTASPPPPAAGSLVPVPSVSSGDGSPSVSPGDCPSEAALTLVLQGGKALGTGAVLVAKPGEFVRIVVESDSASRLSVVGTQVSADVLAGDGLSLCASFPRGRFPVTVGGVQVASVDTSEL